LVKKYKFIFGQCLEGKDKIKKRLFKPVQKKLRPL